MNKRLIAIFLVIVLLFSMGLAGCSKEATSSPNDKQVNNEQNEANKNEEKNIKDEENNKENSNENNEESKEDEGTQNNSNTEDESEANKDENIVYVTAGRLNVRTEGSLNGKVIGTVIKGTPVKVLEEKANESGSIWYKIEFNSPENNNEGWISSKYTAKDKMESLGIRYRELDLEPQDKVNEYPGNPRVEVKGVYLTIHSASNKRLDELIEMAKRTKINAFVIDVKDDNGNMLFPTKAAEKFCPEANKKAPIKDIEAFMKKLKDNNIYTIARIVSFKDPKYASKYPDKTIVYKNSQKPFTNRDGIIWVSPHDRQLWQYNIEVCKEAAMAGFNEIQFDYVRFPASNGGKLDKYLDYRNELGESKPLTIQRYLKYARKELSPLNVYISADIYGLVGSVADDMGIGQYWEAVSNIADYVCPMMYPSHYGNGVYGLPVPDAYPYETIYRGVQDALKRNGNLETPAIIRPWIQDFTATWVKGHIRYGANEIKAQIKALEDSGIKEFLLWNPSNRYSEGGLK